MKRNDNFSDIIKMLNTLEIQWFMWDVKKKVVTTCSSLSDYSYKIKEHMKKIDDESMENGACDQLFAVDIVYMRLKNKILVILNRNIYSHSLDKFEFPICIYGTDKIVFKNKKFNLAFPNKDLIEVNSLISNICSKNPVQSKLLNDNYVTAIPQSLYNDYTLLYFNPASKYNPIENITGLLKNIPIPLMVLTQKTMRLCLTNKVFEKNFPLSHNIYELFIGDILEEMRTENHIMETLDFQLYKSNCIDSIRSSKSFFLASTKQWEIIPILVERDIILFFKEHRL